MEKHFVKVLFENGDYIKTTINGTKEEIRDYYVGNYFNIGNVEDNLQKCTEVEFVD